MEGTGAGRYTGKEIKLVLVKLISHSINGPESSDCLPSDVNYGL